MAVNRRVSSKIVQLKAQILFVSLVSFHMEADHTYWPALYDAVFWLSNSHAMCADQRSFMLFVDGRVIKNAVFHKIFTYIFLNCELFG